MTPAVEARIRVAFQALADELVAALEMATTDTQPVERLLSVSDAARALGGIARSTVYREIAAGRLRSVRVASRRMVPQSSIDAYAAGQVFR
jgi:excisionase family DNA binding protein